MSIAIVPDTLTISTDDTAVHLGVLRMLLRNAAGYIVTVRTLEEPDGIDVYVLATRPDQLVDHLYGAAHLGDHMPLPAVPFPVIAYSRIVGIHIY